MSLSLIRLREYSLGRLNMNPTVGELRFLSEL